MGGEGFNSNRRSLRQSACLPYK